MINYNDERDNPDIKKGTIFKFNDYICEVDDFNEDNPNESIVFIYKSQKDYENGDYLEIISVLNKDIKINIEEYMQDKYNFKTNDYAVNQDESSYFTFVLGYDLLNDMLTRSSTPENDISYDFCSMIAKQFMKSEYYLNEKYSAYEMLEKWVNDNKSYIATEYAKIIGDKNFESKKTRELENGIVIDVGYRRNEPIALVELKNGDSKEFVVAFSYVISNNKINWGYGYYYSDNLEKAKHDFEKVIAGGNLANTFDKTERDDNR